MSDYISEAVDGILRLFGPEKMMLLYSDFVRIFDIWNMSDEEQEALQSQLENPLDQIKLIRSAYALSILAENHGKDLKKMTVLYPKFNELCSDITKNVNRKLQSS